MNHCAKPRGFIRTFVLVWMCYAVLMQQSVDAWVSDITLSNFASGSQGQIIWGATAGDKSGICVSGGDINGDGYGDVIIGSPNDDFNGNNAGAAHVLFGHSAPFNTVDLQSFTPGAPRGYKFSGDVTGAVFGTDVAVLGDMNGDGVKDFALVCPLCSSPSLTQNGKVYVIYGRRYNDSFTQNSLSSYPTGTGGFRIIGASNSDSIGTAIASAGDFNKDGRADLLISAPTKNTRGTVYLIFGQTSENTFDIALNPSEFFSGANTGFRISGGGSPTVYSKVGQSVAAAGDVNGDTYDDIVIGAPGSTYAGRTNCGAAVVIFGRSASSGFGDINLASGIASTVGFPIYGAADNDELGFSVSSMKKMNGDIYSDLIMGAPNVNGVFGATSQGGSVWVYYGRSTSAAVDVSSINSLGAVFSNLAGTENLGTAVVGLGDVNGDGFDDFAMTAPFQGINGLYNAGVVYVIYGQAAAFSTPQDLGSFTSGSMGYRVIGPADNANLGISVSSAGDYNRDGLKDIVVGAHLADANGRVGAGVSYVLFGEITVPTARPTVNPSLGSSLSPSLRPSLSPSTNPTVSPSVNPSVGPSRVPSAAPSMAPSGAPSVNPTVNPSVNPSIGPSRAPSIAPSVSPSAAPSVNPTLSPSAGPSAKPSLVPSVTPSASPSANPTFNPSVKSSAAPSIIPSLQPSPLPTNTLTAAPTVNPSIQPSVAPTNSPSASPTKSTAADIDLLSFVPGVDGLFYGGSKPYENMGNSATNVGDFNGDGLNDFAFSSYASIVNGQPNVGSVYVLLGQASVAGYPPYSDLANFTTMPGVGFMIHGAGSFDQFGRTVLGVGDLNGDNLADMAILSWHAPTAAGNSIYVIYGSTMPVVVSVNISSFRTSSTTGYRIFSVGMTATANVPVFLARGGDVNGDDLDDFVVSIPSASYGGGTNNGAVWVIYGTTSAASDIYLQSHTAGPRGFIIFGSSNGNIGTGICVSDFDHDGLADVVFTQRTTLTSVTYVLITIYGSRNATNVNMTAFTVGNNGVRMLLSTLVPQPGSPTLTRLGDFNGDGIDDIALGVSGYPYLGRLGGGAVAAYFGLGSRPSNVVSLGAEQSAGRATLIVGEAASNAVSFLGESGDLNGDGTNDIILAGRSATYSGRLGSGIVYVLFGGPRYHNMPIVDLANLASGVDGFRIYGALQADYIGFAMGGAGDLNRDGLQDFYVSSPTINAFGRIDNGGVYVLFRKASLQATHKPSVVPTLSPSALPSHIPSTSPSFAPSAYPTMLPSMQPSAHPSVQPSFSPSWVPSVLPSVPPSHSPSAAPSVNPWVLDLPISSLTSGPRGQIIWGALDGDHSGTSVSGGDVNGDGYSDVLVSSVDNGESAAGAGAVYVLFGHNAPFSTVDLAGLVQSATTGLKYKGFDEGDRVGRAVAVLGDMNGDGVKDYAIGCPDCSGGVGQRIFNGVVYVLYGRRYNTTFTVQTLFSYTTGTGGFRIYGETDNDGVGASVASAGDFNKDGYADLLVGAPDQAGYGYVYLILGKASGSTVDVDLAAFTPSSTRGFKISGGIGATAAFSQIGKSVSAASDVNSDGFGDILIGAPGTSYSGRNNCGATVVIFGHDSSVPFVNIDLSQGVLSSIGFYLFGAAPGDNFGFSVGVIKNLNGDAYPDFIIGAPNTAAIGTGTSRGGSAWVYYGRNLVSHVDMNGIDNSIGAIFAGLQVSAGLGYAVAGLGDINGDGFDDFAVSAPTQHYDGFTATGVVYVVYGKASPFTSPQDLSVFVGGAQGYRVTGSATNSFLGYSLSSAGDFNKDGLKDIVIGSQNAQANGRASAGVSYVLFGVSTVLSVAPSAAPSASPSAAPSAAPSLSPSSSPTVIPTGTPSVSPTLSPTNSPSVPVTVAPTVETVDLYSNALTSAQGFNILGAADSDNLGSVVANIGDINGDGIDDLAMAASNFDVGNLVDAGVVYVLYGNRTRSVSDIDLLHFESGPTGFRILGPTSASAIGTSISVIQNFHGDGVKHILVGARTGAAGGPDGAGAVFAVVAQPYLSDVNLSSPLFATQGFSIAGAVLNDGLGNAVTAGDFNNDGTTDMLLSSYSASRGGVSSLGVAYVLLGRAGNAIIQLSNFVTGLTWGLKVIGVESLDILGTAIAAAGDINGDGFADVVITAAGARLPATSDAVGIVYVVFGTDVIVTGGDVYTNAGFTRNGHGFRILGTLVNGRFGHSIVTSIDVNSDGRLDFLVGAAYTSGPTNSGSLYVIYGRNASAVLNDVYMSNLTDATGFRIKGTVSGRLGSSVAAAGDVNGDGIQDFVVGAPQTGTAYSGAGTAYVIYGARHELRSYINLALPLPRSVGFRLIGSSFNNRVGHSVSAAGDFNGDGLADIITGNFLTSLVVPNRQQMGTVTVWFGYSNNPTGQPTPRPTSGPSMHPTVYPTAPPSKDPTTNPTVNPSASPSATISASPTIETKDLFSNALSAAQGFTILGAADNDLLGFVVTNIGDINGDGIEDLALAAPNFDIGNLFNAGVVYVLYGNHTRPVSDIDLLNFQSGRDGFRIIGPTSNSAIGNSISVVQNFHGDGAKHILVGARTAVAHGPSGAGAIFAVKAYPYEADVNLSSPLFATQGFTISGEIENDNLGNAVSAGDFDGDGSTDLLLSTSSATQSGTVSVGVAYVLLSRPSRNSLAEIALADFITSYNWGLKIVGANVENYLLGISIAAAGDVNDDGYADVAVAAAGALLPGTSTSVGMVYVIFGGLIFIDGNLVVGADFTHNGHGFRLIGALVNGRFGYSISTSADVNGDGVRDFLVGAPNTNDSNQSGTVYVIYGRPRSGVLNDVYMSDLTASTGYWMTGNVLNARLGHSVAAAGDVNGDGIQDFVVGAPQTALAFSFAGIAHIIYGTRAFRSNINLALPLSSSVGFRLLGSSTNNRIGYSVSAAGDLNGDGFADIITGNHYASSLVPNRQQMGTATVLFGSSNNPTQQPSTSPTLAPTVPPIANPSAAPSVVPTAQPTIQTLVDLRTVSSSSQLGYQIVGEHAADSSGGSVAAAGDLNRDGLQDFLLSATGYDQNGVAETGIVYVLYGQPNNVSTLDLRNFTTGARGFRIVGSTNGEMLGRSVSSAGDFDGDGYPDIMVAARYVGGTGSYGVYVFLNLGRALVVADVSVQAFTTGSAGFVIYGTATDNAGFSLSPAGDMNHDGIDDIIVGASVGVAFAGAPQTGMAYVIFGKRTTVFSDIYLSAFVSGPTGFRVIGVAAGNLFAYSVSPAGDVNGDGIDDVIIGARNAIITGAAGAGSAYVMFGHTNSFSFADINASNYTSGYYIPGFAATVKTGVSVSGAGDVNGDGIADIIVGSSGGVGKAHVIFGQRQASNSLRVIDLNALCATSGAGFCISGAIAGQNLGRVVKSAGDINADGFDDLFVCAQGATGVAYVFYGHSTATSFANIDVGTFHSGPQGFVVTYGQAVIGIGSSGGDVNGDGVDDIIIAVSAADVAGRNGAGVSYVVYGRNVYPATSLTPTTHPTLSPTKIPTRAPTIVPTASPTQPAGDIRLPLGNDGTRGVKITGRHGYQDNVGFSVSGAGDMDGDGCDEILLGAPFADTGDGLTHGIVYVIFGQRSNSTVSLVDLDSFVTGVHGLRIIGYQRPGGGSASLGYSVGTAGDVNGDGLADIILGAPGVDPFGQRANAGAAFVVFGASNLRESGDLSLQNLNGYNGFAIWGKYAGDQTGYSVASVGDWNGDGLSDVIVGSPFYQVETRRVGAAYVVIPRHNSSNFFAHIDLLHLPVEDGLHIVGPSGWIAYMGYAVALAGDVNGDGKQDVIIGAPQKGCAFVIYGNATGGIVFVDTLVANGAGFKIFDESVDSRLGLTVSGVGDINNDGIDDIIIGAPYQDPAYLLVVFGCENYCTPRNINFTAAMIETSRGFVIHGPYSFGAGLSHGDLNGDGVDEILVGAPGLSNYDLNNNGAVYSLSGNMTMGRQTINPNTLHSNVEMGFRIIGGESFEGIGNAVDSCDFNGDGVPDLVFGAKAADDEAGGAYVVLGTPPPPTSSPTGIPTGAPTLSPSSAPTLIPSTVPTLLPSTIPSVRPSTNPTADPSSGPTLTPSLNPSEAPSVSPSADPSITPTVLPSVQPSIAPSVSSTVGPSIVPTMTLSINPSAGPSVNPSAGPSVSPSIGPSVNPSVGPSVSPSIGPSVNPSAGPSVDPSAGPSASPTVILSINPTIHPSIGPFVHPSWSPMDGPSVAPSVNPSIAPTNNPTTYPTTTPSIITTMASSATPVVDTILCPSAKPSAVFSLLPTVTPSDSPTWGPSVHPSQRPSVQRTAEPTFVSSVDPTATLTLEPSAHPSALPSMQPSSQPSGQPSTQPTAQPSRQPSRQPSSQPSGQPTSDPSAAPSRALVPGEWAAEIGNKTALSVVAPVNDVLWACGSSLDGAGGAPSCLVANTETGAVLTRYKFPWDAITSIVSKMAFNGVYLTGRVTATAVTSNIAVCAINEVPLFCAVQGFPDINIMGASFNAVALKIVYVGLNTNFASATLYDTGTSTAANYVYTNPNMQSITLSRVQSASSFIGSFVAGTGVRTAGATNLIVMGWLRADTGQLSAAVIGPTSGSIINSADLVTAMALESTGPDSFIGGSLQLSDGAGVNAYVVRCNALYRSVVYAARYRAKTVTTSRRMLSTAVADSFTSTKLTAMVLVGDLSYMAIELTSVSEGGVKSLSVVKARTSSGSILKQVLITSKQSASLTCTDISFTGLNLNLACSAQYQSSFKQSVLLSAEPDLTFSQLPTGFIRSTRNNTLLMETIPMQAFPLPVTTAVTNVASERYAYTDSENKPSLKPTAAPTVSPSHQPSGVPSGQPSSSPTATPSISSQPSSHPSTSGPTATYKPSFEPSVRPTTRPSVTSTVKPSARPSASPSVRPTMKPSNRPTPQPSEAPTANPTRSPIAPTRSPTRLPSIAKTVSPTRAPSVVPTIAEVPLIDNTTSKSRSDDITVVIGASLGSAFGLLFLLYVARKSLVYVHKERSKQKKLNDYFKRLDLLKQNSNDAAVVIPMIMVPEKYKKRGAYISTSPTNSNHGRSPTARQLVKKRQTHSDSVVTPTASVDIPDLVPEEPADARSQSDSLSDSYNISSFNTSEEGAAEAEQELYHGSPALHPVSRENLLEEGRIVSTIIDRSASPASDFSAGVVSTSSRASSDTFDGAFSDSSVVSSVSDELVSSGIQRSTKIVPAGAAGAVGGAAGHDVSWGEENVQVRPMSSDTGVDSLDEDAGFQDFIRAMSEEFNSDTSSQDDSSVDFSM